jgi:RNA polymerase sigma-70 factor (ECF subfamily)
VGRNDDALVRRAVRSRKGQGAAARAPRAAVAELFERHRPRLRALALRMTRSEADADDVVQDTFVAVLQKIGTFRGESAFGSWVYRVAANFALMRLRSAPARRNTPLDAVEEPASAAGLPDEVCDILRRLREVEQAFAMLREGAREVIELRTIEGWDTSQVAEKLGISEDAVKVRLHRARVALAELLAA